MHRLIVLSLTTLIVASPAQSKAMKWMDGPTAGMPAGSKFAVVSGDPAKEGSNFVIRAKLPANFVVPPHHHPGDEMVRVLSGGPLAYGMGDKVNQASAGSLTKGYHITMQAGMNHWASNSAATEIEVSGKGPFGITYVDPKDDPRNAAK
jgi:quercetin dioxygenase-like cupin family protein